MKKCIYIVVILFTLNILPNPPQLTFAFNTAQTNQQRIQLANWYFKIAQPDTLRFANKKFKNQQTLQNFILNSASINTIKQAYYAACNSMSKQQMLNLLQDQIQQLQGYSAQDAQDEITTLEQKSLADIKDYFIDFQKRFVTHDDQANQNQDQQNRLHDQHETYTALQQQDSLLHKIPLVRNVASMVFGDLAVNNEQELFNNIRQAMQRAGLNQQDIEDEISKLQNSSLAQLQEQYSSASKQLAQRLYYFNANPHTASPTLQAVDTTLQFLHTWGTTATAAASSIAQFYGYDTTLLDSITNFSLLNPIVSLSNTTTKQDMLRMILAQYQSFDQILDTYLDPEYQEITFSTKQETLTKISEYLSTIQVPKRQRQQLMETYKKLSKSELESTAVWLKELSNQIQQHPPTVLERTIMLQTKSSLIDAIRTKLRETEYSPEIIEQAIENLHNQPIEYARMLLFDLKNNRDQFEPEKPIQPITNSTSMLDTAISHLPSLAIKPVFTITQDRIAQSVAHEKNSHWYAQWKVKQLQHSIQPNFLDHTIHNVANIAAAASFTSTMEKLAHA